MSDLVARTGRHQQRYHDGCRLVAGCIPYQYKHSDGNCNVESKKTIEVLMITSPSGPGMLFPKIRLITTRVVIGRIASMIPTILDTQVTKHALRGCLVVIGMREYGNEVGGWENDETDEAAAEREAMEEAGVIGKIEKFLGYYYFKSKTHQDEFCPEGLCKASMFALHVSEILSSWPEMSARERKWLTIPDALKDCRHPWMHDALKDGFSTWLAERHVSCPEDN